ncbi:MAG: hypothetical protein EOP53_04810 [Sphingobacteriales bacterium]|nr:MAG: hypothetical protein EOP53_04810 [Sphingobacteriales bacterium]
MMKNLICFIFFCFTLVACANHDEGFTTVEGTLVDEFSKVVLPNRELSFLEGRNGALLSGREDDEFAIVKTDSEGKFSFQFEAKSDYKYRVQVSGSVKDYYGGSTQIKKAKKISWK